jgi:hypothetical protein
MPKITIEYEHPHELTDLLAKLATTYSAEQCAIEPDKIQNELAQGYRDRIADLVKQNQELRKQVDDSKEDDYRIILKRCMHWLIPEQPNPHGLTEFSFDELSKMLPELVRLNIVRNIDYCEKLINTESQLKAAEIYIECSGLKKDSAHNPFKDGEVNVKNIDEANEILGMAKSKGSDNLNHKELFGDTEKKLFSLVEAKEYLDIDSTEILALIANNDLKPVFLLSDLRKIKYPI